MGSASGEHAQTGPIEPGNPNLALDTLAAVSCFAEAGCIRMKRTCCLTCQQGVQVRVGMEDVDEPAVAEALQAIQACGW